ncbi:SHOCT domain-containing protein [Promicromonospora kroppenstedtii]|uniref:SHOCT domain-containing protein n=1 Tax=Promicromonospora kroppenstedtii TaxID=440482 RepID=UPI0004AD5DEE|nr:SHOCT domain-containing protein [Promicromonospora kroppenstedtii]
MGLIGGMARTAVVAGTATAVSNRVSRRQANRWAAQESYAQPQAPQQVYVAPPPPQPASSGSEDVIAQLERLGKLRDEGVLTDAEFSAQKARLLAG